MSPLRKFPLISIFIVALLVPIWALAQSPTPTLPPPPTLDANPTFFPTPTLTATPPDVVMMQPISLNYGDVINGMFTEGEDVTTYQFAGHAGDIVSARLVSSVIRLHFIVLGDTGILYNKWISSTNTNLNGSQWDTPPFQVPADGLYTLRILNSDRRAGPYTLSLLTPVLNPLPLGEAVEGNLSVDNPLVYYSFNGKAGDTFTFSLNSGEFNSFLTVSRFDLNQTGFLEDADSGGNFNAFLGPYVLPVDGLYIVTVRDSHAGTHGRYRLQRDSVNAQPVQIGQTIEAIFTAQTPFLYYRFEGKVSDLVDIQVDSRGVLDTTLSLYAPHNNTSIVDDDGANGDDPELTDLLLWEDGTYFIKLSRYDAGATGQVSLTLNRSIKGSLDVGPQDIFLNEKHVRDDVLFQGVAGERVRLQVEISGEKGVGFEIVQNGEFLASFSANQLPVFITEFVTPQDGEVRIRATNTNPMHLRLSLEHLSKL